MMGWLLRRMHGEQRERELISSTADEELKGWLNRRADELEQQVRDRMLEAQESVINRRPRRRFND